MFSTLSQFFASVFDKVLSQIAAHLPKSNILYWRNNSNEKKQRNKNVSVLATGGKSLWEKWSDV